MTISLTDTHAHLDYPDFAADLEAVVARAAGAGVARIVTIGTGVASSRRAVALAERFPCVFAVVGLHPTNVCDEPAGWLEELRPLASHPHVVAIGETGLDYHHPPSDNLPSQPGISALGAEMPADTRAAIIDGAYRAAQEEAFRAQLDLAAESGLNVVIHQRDAWDDTLRILRSHSGGVRGVFHCFGNTPDQAAEVIAMGHMVSFTGILTFKNAALVRETAASVPEGSFMVETDCPYLAPTPHRGKRCEPAHTRLVAETLAHTRGVPVDHIAAATEAAADKFFAFRRPTGRSAPP